MGQLTCKLWKKKIVKILILGLDAAGKTTILYNLKLGEVVTTIPTIGFNVERIEEKSLGLNFTAWDIGGRCKLRPLLRHYYSQTDAVIYIVDSNDKERLGEALEEFHSLLGEDELRESQFLLLCNKQDLSSVLSTEDVKAKLNSHNRDIGVFPVVGTDRKSLMEPLIWLSGKLGNQKTWRLATQSLAEAKEIVKPVTNPMGYFKQSWAYIKSFIV